MSRKVLFIDYEYCTGCHTCEVACKVEKNLPDEQFGIKVAEIGPWKIDETHHWQYSYLPVPTDQCDLCSSRTAKGKVPTCVAHCQANVMKYGDIDSFAEDMQAKAKVVCFTIE